MEKEKIDEIFAQYAEAMKNRKDWLTEAERKEYDSLWITDDEVIDAMAKLAIKLIKEMIIDTERYKSIENEKQMMYAINAVIRSFNGIMHWRFKKYGWDDFYWELSEAQYKNKKCVFDVSSHYFEHKYIYSKGETWLDKIQYLILIYIKKKMEILYDKDCFTDEGYLWVFFYKRMERISELRELEQKRANEYDGKNRL